MRVPGTCYSCQQEAGLAAAPLSERAHVSEFWRAAHAFDTTLPGWLVLVPRRHVTSFADLTPDEAAELGPLLHRLSQALRDTVRCAKTYVMQFAEAEGFSHLHIHVVPRMPDLPAEHRGPRVFHYLSQPPDQWLPIDRRDAIAAGVAAAMSR